MSTYKTVRGKNVRLGKIGLDVDAETGNLVIVIQEADSIPQTLSLDEKTASDVYNLLGDVMEWESQNSTTENEINRLAEDDVSGEADDNKAASNK